jgi:ABC-type sugar transport system substrate-binding protein
MVAVAAAAASSGCGSGDFLPPPPPELQGAIEAVPGSAAGPRLAAGAVPLPVAPAGIRSIEIILSGHLDIEETELQKAAARAQAGLDRARLRITVPGERPRGPDNSTPTPTDQSRLVRDAVARHPQALIIDPADPADRELAQAVKEAGEAKVPVILLGQALSPAPNAQPANPNGSQANPIVVAPPPFTDSARQLVASAIRNAKNAKLKPEDGAVLLVNTAGDPFIPDRVAALRDALKAAGITAIDEIRFARDSQAAHKLLLQRLEAGPKRVMVFSVDSLGAQASNQTAGQIVEDRPFVQAGYTSDEALTKMVTVGEFAALTEFPASRLVRKAISTAVAAAQGRDVPGRVEFPVVFHDSPPTSGVPHLQAQYKARKKAAASP